MSISKSMMDKMMPFMTKGLSKEDKMEMMGKMMPQMMEGVSMIELMPKMMVQLLPMFVDELKQMGIKTENILPKIIGKVLPKMMKLMNKDEMEKMKKQILANIMKDENLKNVIPQFFMEMMPIMVPDCLEAFMKELPVEKANAFKRKMVEIYSVGLT